MKKDLKNPQICRTLNFEWGVVEPQWILLGLSIFLAVFKLVKSIVLIVKLLICNLKLKVFSIIMNNISHIYYFEHLQAAHHQHLHWSMQRFYLLHPLPSLQSFHDRWQDH